MKQQNNLIFQSLAIILAIISFLFSIQIYFTGHFNPGGGFIGGLICTSGLTILLLAFDVQQVKKWLPINYLSLSGIGLIISILTGAHAMLTNNNFFKHHFTHIHFPILGDLELHTAAIFDLGVYLIVVGVLMTIILSMLEDR